MKRLIKAQNLERSQLITLIENLQYDCIENMKYFISQAIKYEKKIKNNDSLNSVLQIMEKNYIDIKQYYNLVKNIFSKNGLIDGTVSYSQAAEFGYFNQEKFDKEIQEENNAFVFR